jgi:cysteinylglycine-S-conjugate dipeptidase
MSGTHHVDDVLEALDRRRGHVRRQLEELVRIPSISAPGHDAGAVRRSAELTQRILSDAGYDDVRLLEVDDAHPYVAGSWSGAGPDAPTILLYAHHDVQPIGTPDGWSTDPFEPSERDGRLYGRGTADDKAGVMVHAAALAAWLDATEGPPVNLQVLIEGEEEIGSPHLDTFLDVHADDLRSDVIIATDLVNWQVGVPALTYTLRGLAEVYVTVSTLEQPLHSGMWGGPVPDALSALLQALASLTDETGRPAVEGIYDDVREPTDAERERIAALELDPEGFRGDARMLDGVTFTGDPDVSLLERVWMQPAITTIGIDVPHVAQASNTLLARARAKVSIRLAPGQDPDRVTRLVADHVRDAVPWGAEVETRPGHGGEPWVAEPRGPAFESALSALSRGYGSEAVLLGAGGTIPFVGPMSAAFGDVPCLLTGIEDPASNAHGEDESLHLEDFHRACRAEAILFAELADRLAGSS